MRVKEEITPEVERVWVIIVVIIGIVRWIGITIIVRISGVIVVRWLGISIVLFGIGNGRGLPIAHRTPDVTIAVAATKEKEYGEKTHGQKPFSHHFIHLPSF
jgi:hypothetical protein